MEQGFQVLLQAFGGLALFLYGTDSLCRAVQQGAGRRLRSLLADRKSTRLNSSHNRESRMPSSA